MIVVDRTSWVRLVFTLYGSVLPRIWPRLLVLALVAEGVVLLQSHYGFFHNALSVQPFSIMGIALGIFLGFRNNTCYDRWWEGRLLWGKVTNDARNFARQLKAFNASPEGADAQNATLIRATIAWVHALRHRLRQQSRPEELAPFLPPEVLESLRTSSNPPMRIVAFISEELRTIERAGHLAPVQQSSLEETLSELMNHQGGCERIKSTPIPISYSVLLHRLVALYCFGLPFALVGSLGHVTTLVSVVIAYAFIGIDEVGHELEDPFGEDPNDLPLLAISQTIEANLREMIDDHEGAPTPSPDARGTLR